ncbi:hypothetical protein A1F94_003666 [Pyrenophora tritici-repentis]|uniref:Uncharacterized protein n=2 Tax=Pyrenophora tritici-repentis TaxID=45151 RepID=A0A834VRK2_9PLEO|nr:uncharacterized protein PTRG_02388 [Pyrenophora tritici-repentis Pt-1C-BFP]KAF7574281.1 hypothetical protein PtrM4_059040 [Pyrenophora tritici-repentis]EDU44911.1 predicted protein [Pyrenophora tritici-repentis Pt-1C-BFP]KAG9386916.1 hypothetical protein A1F94_003666 [Pyrenophora tritici-repentis]KAI1518375.1 hypothetical protein Ptr86124_001503 [Pyrenophora tritici-repentis]KAI1671957.1 hypothetical protein L13192_02816 [Pyrenophora tritici-repentis]
MFKLSFPISADSRWCYLGRGKERPRKEQVRNRKAGVKGLTCCMQERETHRTLNHATSDQFTGGGHGPPVLAAAMLCEDAQNSLAGLDADQDCNAAHLSSD